MKQAYHAHKANPQGEPRVYTQDERSPWAEEKQSTILMRINDESLTYGGVHVDWKEGGGTIIGEGCHFIDFLTFLAGAAPVSVTAVALPDEGKYHSDNVSMTSFAVSPAWL